MAPAIGPAISDSVLPAFETAFTRQAMAGWKLWLLVIGGALLLRLAFYTGYFGSDEVTYTLAAFDLLRGNWTVPQYVGANRYGVNLPVAGFALLFGQNEFAAAVYSMACSLAEIAIVFHFGQQMLGRRAGFFAAAIMASLPIHVHYAGRLMADAPLALAMTASFLFFWAGENRNRSALFVWAGLAAGCVFWIKPHAMLYLVVFAAYPIVFRRWNRRWLWVFAGLATAVLANLALLWFLTGHPLFIFDVLRNRQTSGYLESGAAAGSILDSPLFYVIYFFAKIYHTWLLAYLALLAVVLWRVSSRGMAVSKTQGVKYLIWWSFGLVAVFSLFVVSLRPLLFVPKQANYMLMFVAPLALLAGHALAQFGGIRLWVAAMLIFVPSILLSGMQQSLVRVFTANSKATLEFARSHADSRVFVNTNAARAVTFENLVNPTMPVTNVQSIGDLKAAPGTPVRGNDRRYAIIDTETLSWGTDEPITSLAAVPACWVKAGVLRPGETGFGTRMLSALRPLAVLLPSALRNAVEHKLDGLTRPAAAYIFEVPATGCAI